VLSSRIINSVIKRCVSVSRSTISIVLATVTKSTMFKGRGRNRDKKDKPKAEDRPPQDPNRKESSDGSVSQASSANRVPSASDGSNSRGSKHLSDSNSECSKTEDLTASRRTGFTGIRSVKFAYVQVQEYERIIADNPSCSSGAPIG
jgi:hypothetical protein